MGATRSGPRLSRHRTEPFERAFLRLAPLFVPIPWGGADLQLVNETVSGGGDFVYRPIEDLFVHARRPRRPAQLSNELQGRRADLIVGGWGCKVRQRLDVATHARASCRSSLPESNKIITPRSSLCRSPGRFSR